MILITAVQVRKYTPIDCLANLLSMILSHVLFTAFKPQISWYVFGRHTYEHTLPMLGDELQQPTNYISPVSSIEKSDTHVVISEPILVYFFDKDSKEAAGE